MVRVDFLRVALIRVDIMSQSTTIPVWPWSHNVGQFHRLKYNSYCVMDRDGVMYTEVSEVVTLSSLDFTLNCGCAAFGVYKKVLHSSI